MISETFAETLPQLFVLILLMNSEIIDDGQHVGSAVFSFFLLKLYLSILSSSFGMAKFLQLGPCQFIPKNKMGIGMGMITIANFLGLLWKGLFITAAFGIYFGETNPSTGPTNMFFELFWRSCCIVLLPGLILVAF